MTDERETQGHDCEKCDKVPSRIEIVRTPEKREYRGIINLNDASFAYTLRFTGDISRIKDVSEVPKYIDFSIADSDGKTMTLDEQMNAYFMMVVGAAAIRFEHEMMIARNITGTLEKILGGKVELQTETSYRSCMPSNDHVKQFLQEYKARGQKAK